MSEGVSVKRDDVNEFLKSHGIDTTQVRAGAFTPEHLLLEVAVLDDNGNRQLTPNGRDLLTTFRVIPFDESDAGEAPPTEEDPRLTGYGGRGGLPVGAGA